MKNTFKRLIPSREHMRQHPHMRHFGKRLHDPDLWHLNRHSASGAVALGLFVCFLPVPMQMLIAAAGAIMFRVNLPISVVTVWVSNPITFGPMMLLAYQLGAMILDMPFSDIDFHLDVKSMLHTLIMVWEPLLLGCLIYGVILALAGYLMIRMLWWFHIIKAIEKRKLRQWRKKKKT